MLHEKHLEWLTARGFERELLEHFAITTTSVGGANWLSVPYVEHGRTVNHKFRLTSEKRHMMDAGAPLCLWNHDTLLEEPVQTGQAPVIITEGEWDALTAIQSGFVHCVSVPNGAPREMTDGAIDPDNDAERFRFLWRAKANLDLVSTFILAVDADEPGRVLAAELARRLGPERCKFVTYPEGCKDLNEVLRAHGQTAVAQLLMGAKPYPIKGLFRISEFPDPPVRPSMPLNLPGAVNGIELVPGTLTVWTGFAGSGKTSLMCFVVADLMRRGINVTMGSFETAVKPILQTKLRAAILRCSDKDTTGTGYVTAERLAAADALIDDRFRVVCQDFADEDHELTLEELLELCRITVLRDGARLIIIDPWNEIEHKMREGESETAYTSRAIRALKAFARAYDVALWVVAHPKKPAMWGQKPEAPGLYDISGSAHWANKADYGAVVHRPNKESPTTHVVIVKVRMGLPGREQTVKMDWEWQNSVYVAHEPSGADHD